MSLASPRGLRSDRRRSCDHGSGSVGLSIDAGGLAEATVVETSSGCTERMVLYVIVDPAEIVLELEPGARASLPFTATAVYDDGSSADVTENVEWEVSNALVGEMNGSTLELVGHETRDVVSAVVTAELGERIGRSELTVGSSREAEGAFVLHILPISYGWVTRGPAANDARR